MSEPNSTTQSTENVTTPAQEPGAAPEKTFTQAELDSIVGKRLAKAMKGMPGDEELSAFRAWKESQQTEKERWDALTKERDESKTALTAAQSELEQLKRERYLLGKGVPAGDVDYYAFKIAKEATEAETFEQAAERFLKEHAPREDVQSKSGVRVEFGAPLSGGNQSITMNDYINARLRGK